MPFDSHTLREERAIADFGFVLGAIDFDKHQSVFAMPPRSDG
jgi:hypothetical protein